MKKMITPLLVVTLVLSLFILSSAIAAEAETFTYEIPDTTMTLNYKVLENNTVEITSGYNMEGELVIPAEIDGKVVTSIGGWAFFDCPGLTEITIPDSVTSIGVGAFQYCTGLSEITLPDSLIFIGDYAFYGCTGLTHVTIPDSVISVGSASFENCTALVSVVIGKSVTNISSSSNNSSFQNCVNLKDITLLTTNPGFCMSVFPRSATFRVTIGDSFTSIRQSLFSDCVGLVGITIPNSVTEIGNYAFDNCTGLTEIVIPASVTSIGEWAFYGTGLTEIAIPDSVTSIGEAAFAYCPELTKAYYAATLPIDTGTFYGCDNLTEVYCDGKLLPRLATPSDLAWNVDHTGNQTLPGYFYYKLNDPSQGEAFPSIHKVDDPSSFYRWASYDNWHTYVEGLIDTDDFESGDYYFTVQEQGDGKNYWNSEIVTSDIWTYVKPDEKLSPISAETLAWNDEKATWQGLDDEENVFGYRVRTYYSPSEDGDFGEWITMTDGMKKEYIEREGNFYCEDEGFYKGNGFYYFTVQAISNNPSVYLNSEESSPSPVFHLHDVISDVNDALSEISEDADIRKEVQKIGTTDLTMALIADKNEEGGTADILRQLEEKTGVTVAVDTAEGFEAFTGTSIIGAALNDVPEGTDTITLNIDAPEKEHVIPTQYKNTVALRFSMGLDGVTAPEDLKVPVKVTLPIPNTINRDFLVLLHYGQDGSVEVIPQPYQVQKDGKWYVSIVLTHFSDFVMTETAQKEEGNKPSGGNSGSSSSSGNGGGGTITPSPSGSGTPAEDISPVDEPSAFVLEEVFDDIAKTAWYYDAVEFVAEKELMNGVGNKRFAPDEYITRASVAQILYNSAETHDTTMPNPFDDVVEGSWYEDAVVWAAEQGIVTGFNANTFGPDGLITREQFAVMLWRHAGKPDSDFELDGFSDADTAGKYAVSALKWAVETEIIKGAGDGTLAPLRNATRAETAQMLMRYFK